MLTGIYSRNSKGKTTSIDQQEAASQAWCEAEGHTVAAKWRDRSSASRFAKSERDDWNLALAAIAKRDIELLVLWESSRGDRNPETWMAFLGACRDNKVLIHVISHHRTYDITRARDWRTLAEDGVDNAYEVEKSRERILRNVMANAAAGRPHGRNQYGYTRRYNARTGQLEAVEINDAESSVILEASRRILAGETTYAVAADFNARDIPTPRSGRWTTVPLGRLIRDPLAGSGGAPLDVLVAEAKRRHAAGEPLRDIAADFRDRGEPGPPIRWDPAQLVRILINPAYNGKRVHRGKVVSSAIWPAILDDDTFTLLTTKLTDPARRKQRDSAVRHLLSGIARCGREDCGGWMRVLPNRGTPSYTCIRCHKVSRIESKVDAVVERAIVALLSDPDCRDLLTAPDRTSDVQAALAELAVLQARLEGYYEQGRLGEMSPAGVAFMEKSLLADMTVVEARTRRVALAPAIDQVIGADAKDRWARMSLAQRRSVIRDLAAVVILPMGRGRRTFNPESVVVSWHHE